MIDLLNTGIRAEFYARAWFTPALAALIREHQLDFDAITRAVGATAVIPIRDCGDGRFEFGQPGSDPLGMVCEALAADGENTEDLVGWHLIAPEKPMSMLGRVGLVGLYEAFNPATYYMGKPLNVHRSVLDYLKAGCKGAAVVNPRLAAYQFLDIPGDIAGRDQAHGRELIRIAESIIDKRRFLVASRSQVTQREAA